MHNLELGIVAHSRKENEHRLPVHPAHFERIDADLRARIYLESGYGEHFGVADSQLAPLVAGFVAEGRTHRRMRRRPAGQAAARGRLRTA